MKKLINCMSSSDCNVEYDTETGEITERPNVPIEQVNFGTVYSQSGEIYAFYRDDKSLLLQNKFIKWRVSPLLTTSIRGFFIFRNFRIKHNDKVILSIWYKPKGLLYSLFDPTYDSIDADSDDFFLYVHGMWKSYVNMPYSDIQNEFRS